MVTPLGRLAGQTATEVCSIIRFVDCLRSLQPAEIGDPTMITAAQTAAELDEVGAPLAGGQNADTTCVPNLSL